MAGVEFPGLGGVTDSPGAGLFPSPLSPSITAEPASGPLLGAGLALKKILRQNHSAPIADMRFHSLRNRNRNLVALVGGALATVMDNEHFGEHLDVFLQFAHHETPSLHQFDRWTQSWLESEDSDGETGVAAELAAALATAALAPSLPGLPSAPLLARLEQIVTSAREAAARAREASGTVGGAQLRALPAQLPSLSISGNSNYSKNTSTTKKGQNSASKKSGLAKSRAKATEAPEDSEALTTEQVVDNPMRQLLCLTWAIPPPLENAGRDISSLRRRNVAHLLALEAQAQGLQAPTLAPAPIAEDEEDEYEDAWLAVGGVDGLVQVLSVAHSLALHILLGTSLPSH